jgi:hypothetical protein
VWCDDALKRWDQAASLAYCTSGACKGATSLPNLLQEAVEVVSTPPQVEVPNLKENPAVDEVTEVVDILPQLLGEMDDLGQEVDVSPKDQFVEAVKELKDEMKKQGDRRLRALEEQTAAIRELNATLTAYFYANGPQRGLTPLPSDKPPTPEKKQICFCLFVLSRTSSFSAIWRLSPLPVTGLQI